MFDFLRRRYLSLLGLSGNTLQTRAASAVPITIKLSCRKERFARRRQVDLPAREAVKLTFPRARRLIPRYWRLQPAR